MKKHVFRRTLSLLLVLCMAMGMIPFAQAAGESESNATVEDKGTVLLS